MIPRIGVSLHLGDPGTIRIESVCLHWLNVNDRTTLLVSRRWTSGSIQLRED